jgi:NAD(P)-dependent dehydrogenase (short-subunit alcohol dehydrogenase family)
MRLAGKVALITGGAGGIGGATARLFVKEGARVALGDIREEAGRRLAEALAGEDRRAIFVRLDVTQEEDWKKAVEATLEAFGRLDILVNNAGIAMRKGVQGTSLSDWEKTMAVNATGVFLGMKAVVDVMKRNGGGSIINISSIYGLVGSAGRIPYHASKGAVTVVTKAAALELAPYGIRVNSVHPGFIDTPMTAPLLADERTRQWMLNATPIGRIGRPEDVAYGILYLASDEASFVTGSELVIDGGYTAQ